MKYLKRVLYALRDLLFFKKESKPPRLIMTLLVKNEAELLEKNLLFHKKMGVDAFVITDNNSTDNTLDIIDKYVKKGWIIDVIKESATNYEQKDWVDRMIWRAKTLFGADWIINADADEFWYSSDGSLKSKIEKASCNVLVCKMQSMYPEEGVPFSEWDKVVRPVPNKKLYDLSLYSLFDKQSKKVIHKASGYIQISMGNHKVKMLPQIVRKSDIIIYHYSVRGRQQFIKKMKNGGEQLLTHKGKHGGRHWRYFYRIFKEGLIEEEYDKVIGTNVRTQLERAGYIYTDETMKKELQKLL